MSNSIPREVVRWLQTLDLSFPVKQPKRDLSNGYTIAEICSRYWPEVPMHSFINQLSVKNKESNWFMLRKVFCANNFVLQTVSPYPNPSPAMKIALRKDMSPEEAEFDDLLVGTMNAQEGSALTLLELLYTGLTKRKIQAAAPLEPENTLERPPPFIKTNAVDDGYVRQSGAMLSKREIQEKEEHSRKSADERKKLEDAKKAEELAKFKSGMAGQSGGKLIAASLVKKHVEAIRQAPKDGEKDQAVEFAAVTVKALPANLLARYGGGGGGGGEGEDARGGAARGGHKSGASVATGLRQDALQSILGYLSNECLGRIFSEELQQEVPATWSFTTDTPCLFTYLVRNTDVSSPLMDTLWERLAVRIPNIVDVVVGTPSFLGELLECFLVVPTSSSPSELLFPIIPLRRQRSSNITTSTKESNSVAAPTLTSCAHITDALRHSLKRGTVDTSRQNLKLRLSSRMPHHTFLAALISLLLQNASFRAIEVFRQYTGPHLVSRLDATHGRRWPFEVTLGFAWVLTQFLHPSTSLGTPRLEMSEVAASQMLRIFSALLDSFGGDSKDSRYLQLVYLVAQSGTSHAALLHNSNAAVVAVAQSPLTPSPRGPNATVGSAGANASEAVTGPQLANTFAHPLLTSMLRHSATNVLTYATSKHDRTHGLNLLALWASTLPPSMWEEALSPTTSVSSTRTLVPHIVHTLAGLVLSATGTPLRTSLGPIVGSEASFRLQGDDQWIAAIDLLVAVLRAPWLIPQDGAPSSWPTISVTTETHPLEVLRGCALEAVEAILGAPSGEPFLRYPVGRGCAPPTARLYAAHSLSHVLHLINSVFAVVYDGDAAEVQMVAFGDTLFAFWGEVDAARPDLGVILNATRSLADPLGGPPAATTELPEPATPVAVSLQRPFLYVSGVNQGPAASLVFLLEAAARASATTSAATTLATPTSTLKGGRKAQSAASSNSGVTVPPPSQPTHHSIVKDGQVPAATTFLLCWAGRLLAGIDRAKQGVSPAYRCLMNGSPQQQEGNVTENGGGLARVSCGMSSDSLVRWWRFLKEEYAPHALVILHAHTLLHQRKAAQAPVDSRAEAIVDDLMSFVKRTVLWAYTELSGLRRALPAAWSVDQPLRSQQPFPASQKETPEVLAAREQASITWFSSHVAS